METQKLYLRSAGKTDVYNPGHVMRKPRYGGPIEYVTVVSAEKKQIYDDEEDGMIWNNILTIRPATDDEARQLRDLDDLQARAQAIKARAREIFLNIQKNGERPEGSQYANGRRYFDSFDIYGGGVCLVVDTTYIWALQNNGMDGDCWSRNNVLTGGAGAIGYRLPRDQALADEISELESEYKKIKNSEMRGE